MCVHVCVCVRVCVHSIITLEYVLVVNPDDEAAQGFIDTLKDKLSHPMYVGKVRICV